MGDEEVERFDGDIERLERGDGTTGRYEDTFARLFRLLTVSEVDPLSEFSVHAPSEETDSVSGSRLMRFFSILCI